MPHGAAFVNPTGPCILIEAFDWTIRDFATPGEPVLRSEVFKVLGDSWQLKLHPNSTISDDRDPRASTEPRADTQWVSLYISYKEESQLGVKFLSYQVELVNGEQAKSITKEASFTFLSKWTKGTSGWENFVLKKEVEDPLKGFLLDGALRLKVHFKIPLSEMRFESRNPLPEEMWKLCSEGVGTDAEIITEDGTVKAHKAVLMGMSTVICKSFVDQMQDQQPCCVDISDFPGRVARAFIEYLYLQRLPIDVMEDDLVDLWALADTYRVASLRHFVERVYGAVVSPDAVLAVMVQENNGGARMKEACTNFFAERIMSSGLPASS